MENTYISRQGIIYWIEDGKYCYDYDFFDTLEEMEADIDKAIAWAKGE